MPLNVFTYYDNIGVLPMVLKHLGINFKVLGVSLTEEEDRKIYKAIHPKSSMYKDLKHQQKKRMSSDVHLFFYKWMTKDMYMESIHRYTIYSRNYRRNRLLDSVEDYLKKRMPWFLIMEGSTQLLGKRKKNFNDWLDRLNKLGYTNYTYNLNTKNYGLPQSRGRIYCVSILHDLAQMPSDFDKYKKDSKFIDFLDSKVDKKYYLPKEFMKRLQRVSENKSYVFELKHKTIQNPNIYRVYSKNGIAPTLPKPTGGGRYVYVLENEYLREGRPYLHKNTEIRKLTPWEYWRLMGIPKEYYDNKKVRKLSNNTLYTLASEATPFNILEMICKELFTDDNQGYNYIKVKDGENGIQET